MTQAAQLALSQLLPHAVRFGDKSSALNPLEVRNLTAKFLQLATAASALEDTYTDNVTCGLYGLTACINVDPAASSKVLVSSALFSQLVDAVADPCRCNSHHIKMLNALLHDHSTARRFAHYA